MSTASSRASPLDYAALKSSETSNPLPPLFRWRGRPNHSKIPEAVQSALGSGRERECVAANVGLIVAQPLGRIVPATPAATHTSRGLSAEALLGQVTHRAPGRQVLAPAPSWYRRRSPGAGERVGQLAASGTTTTLGPSDSSFARMQQPGSAGVARPPWTSSSCELASNPCSCSSMLKQAFCERRTIRSELVLYASQRGPCSDARFAYRRVGAAGDP